MNYTTKATLVEAAALAALIVTTYLISYSVWGSIIAIAPAY